MNKLIRINKDYIYRYIINEVINYNIDNNFCTPLLSLKRNSKYSLDKSFIETLKKFQFYNKGNAITSTNLDKLLIDLIKKGEVVFYNKNLSLIINDLKISDYVDNILYTGNYNYFNEIKVKIDQLIISLNLKIYIFNILTDLIKDEMYNYILKDKNFIVKFLYNYLNITPIKINLHFFDKDEINLDLLKILLNNSKVGLKNNEDRDKFFDYIIPNKNLDKKKSLLKSLNELNKIIEKNKNDNR